MKTMALNQVQNREISVEYTKIQIKIGKLIDAYSKNDTAIIVINILSALIVMTGVVSLSMKLIIAGALIFMCALMPLFYSWCRDSSLQEL